MEDFSRISFTKAVTELLLKTWQQGTAPHHTIRILYQATASEDTDYFVRSCIDFWR
jgi:hypothetical protein